MSVERKIALECPYCRETIYRPLGWFKKPYATCPFCERGLAAGQFAAAVAEIEQSQDEILEEMFKAKKKAGCCGGGKSCG